MTGSFVDTDNYVIRWHGLVTDIDDRKQAQEKLRRREADLLEAHKLSMLCWSDGRTCLSNGEPLKWLNGSLGPDR